MTIMLFRMTRRGSLMYAIARAFILPIYAFLAKTIIEGEHFVPREGPAIVASNHISFIDPFAMGYLARRRKRQVHFLAKIDLFKNPVLGWFLRTCRQIPVDRGTNRAADSLVHARKSLEHGHLIGIYPESTMPEDLIQLPIKSGALRLAIDTGAPIIVVGTWGAHDTWRKGHMPKPRFRRRHAMIVTQPYTLDKDTDVEQAREELAEKMKEATLRAQRKLGS